MLCEKRYCENACLHKYCVLHWWLVPFLTVGNNHVPRPLTLIYLQILMNVLLTPVDVVKPVITLKDHFTVAVMKDMNCLMIKERVET